MARLSLIEKEQLPPAFAALAEKGETASPFIKSTFYQILAHCPEMYQQYFPFYNSWHEGGKVAPVIKELARLKVAQCNDCFTWRGARFAAALQQGLTEEKIAALDNYETSDLFDPQEKMAIRFAELLALNHKAIDDAFMRALREQFTDPQILELGMMIGQYLGFGRLVAVLDVEKPVCTL